MFFNSAATSISYFCILQIQIISRKYCRNSWDPIVQEGITKTRQALYFEHFVTSRSNEWITRLIYSRSSNEFKEVTTGAPHSGCIAEACLSSAAHKKFPLVTAMRRAGCDFFKRIGRPRVYKPCNSFVRTTLYEEFEIQGLSCFCYSLLYTR